MRQVSAELSMDAASGQSNTAHHLPAVEKVRLAVRTKRLDMSLLMETILVTIAAILAVRITEQSSLANWSFAPAILIACSLIATIARKNKVSELGLNLNRVGLSLRLLCWSCLTVFPITFLLLWLMRSFGWALPLRAALPQNQPWLTLLVYQFMYVAVAEEVFFRGYVQSNILRLTAAAPHRHSGPQVWISVVVSAGLFAAAHFVIQGQIVSILTFLPGLLLGWLFVRTRSLLAPILFHGLANTCYYWTTTLLA